MSLSAEELQEREDLRCTICMVKPSSLKHVPVLRQRFKEEGFSILSERSFQLNRGLALRLYYSHFEAVYFTDLIAYLLSGPVHIFHLKYSADNTIDPIEKMAALAGHVDPSKAAMATLRQLYGVNIVKNVLHYPHNFFEYQREKDIFGLIEQPIFRSVIVFGPPASGKGTQCELLNEAYGMIHMSTGDLLREEIKKKSDIGLKAQGYMKQGLLVPDELITALTLNRLQSADIQRSGYILDGFPRTPAQATSLIDAGLHVTRFVFITAAKEKLVARMAGRRLDKQTGQIWHMVFKPPPADILPRLIQREDDKEEVVIKRLHEYEQTIDGVLCQFANVQVVDSEYADLIAHKNNGVGANSISHIFCQIVKGLEGPHTYASLANTHSSLFTIHPASMEKTLEEYKKNKAKALQTTSTATSSSSSSSSAPSSASSSSSSSTSSASTTNHHYHDNPSTNGPSSLVSRHQKNVAIRASSSSTRNRLSAKL